MARDGHLSLASLPLVAWLGSPLRLEADGHPGHWLLLQHQGVSRLQQGDRELPVRGGEALILPGEEPWTLCSRTASCTLLAVDVPQLLEEARLQQARRAAGLRSLPQAWDPWRLRESRRVGGPGDLRGAALLSSLQRLMISLQEVAQLDEDLPIAVLQQTLHGLLGLLLVPEIDDGGDGDDPRIDPLLRYIEEHLDQPLTLQLLEERCHYSRRTLHNVFRQRFDCSPMQWIRQRRMALACARLSAPHDGDTVQAVATACGYRSLSQFSLDVQRFHGQKPSELLRLARAAGLSVPASAAAAPSAPSPG